MEKLKEELASRDEEVARQKEELAQKDELLQKTKDKLMSNATNSYATDIEDAMTQVTCVHPELDLSQIGPGKVVVDGHLVDEE